MFSLCKISKDDIITIAESKNYFEAYYVIENNDNTNEIPLTVERCKLGKNVNKKYEEQFSSIDFENLSLLLSSIFCFFR